jgi:hypothetical protein
MNWMRAKQADIVRRYSSTAELTMPFLCIHTYGDEAGIVLGATDAASEMPYRFGRAVNQFEAVMRLPTRASLIAAIVLAVITTLRRDWFNSHNALDLPAPTRSTFLVILCVIVFMALRALRYTLRNLGTGVEVAKVAAPAGLRKVAFGSTGLSSYWLARFWTQPTPFGVKDLTLKAYKIHVPLMALRRKLRHSSLYEDQAALSDIVAWLTASGREASSVAAGKTGLSATPSSRDAHGLAP